TSGDCELSKTKLIPDSWLTSYFADGFQRPSNDSLPTKVTTVVVQMIVAAIHNRKNPPPHLMAQSSVSSVKNGCQNLPPRRRCAPQRDGQRIAARPVILMRLRFSGAV